MCIRDRCGEVQSILAEIFKILCTFSVCGKLPMHIVEEFNIVFSENKGLSMCRASLRTSLKGKGMLSSFPNLEKDFTPILNMERSSVCGKLVCIVHVHTIKRR